MPLSSETGRQFYYWVKFDKCREPKLLVAPNYEQFKWLLDREVQLIGDMPEWIIRDYAK